MYLMLCSNECVKNIIKGTIPVNQDFRISVKIKSFFSMLRSIFSEFLQESKPPRNHSFSKYGKYYEKLTFLTS